MMMQIYNPLYGRIIIPNGKEEILKEIQKQKEIFLNRPTGYRQAVIDALEEGLEIIRMKEDGLNV